MSPYNIKIGQKITSDSTGVIVDRGFIAHLQISNAIATSNTSTLAATGLTTSAQVIVANITGPTTPRNVKIVGNATGIVGNVVVKGTNYNNEVITETIALNGTTAVEGTKAFKTVTEIDLPIKTNSSGDTVSVGIGEKLGIPYRLAHNTILAAYLDNVKEATLPTVTVSPTALESNTIDLSSSLNGKIVDVYLIA